MHECVSVLVCVISEISARVKQQQQVTLQEKERERYKEGVRGSKCAKAFQFFCVKRLDE